MSIFPPSNFHFRWNEDALASLIVTEVALFGPFDEIKKTNQSEKEIKARVEDACFSIGKRYMQ